MRKEEDVAEAISRFQHDSNVKLEPWPEDHAFDHLKVTIRGRTGTPYAEGNFILEIELSPDYPVNPPIVFCHTIVYHPRIDQGIPKGRSNVCLEILVKKEGDRPADGERDPFWNMEHDLIDVIQSIDDMFHITSFSTQNSKMVNDTGNNADFAQFL
nr:ubiquitin-conjugating enzyme E2 [Candidatus Sigynarchaeota archaeon]